jgi:hypothetical protein
MTGLTSGMMDKTGLIGETRYSFSASSKGNPIVAKAGWLQSRGIKGEAVVIYRNPLITKDLESSGFPVG